jgi:hypothetical protein
MFFGFLTKKRLEVKSLESNLAKKMFWKFESFLRAFENLSLFDSELIKNKRQKFVGERLKSKKAGEKMSEKGKKNFYYRKSMKSYFVSFLGKTDNFRLFFFFTLELCQKRFLFL